MNSTIIADPKYINEINKHILGIVNKTDKIFVKNKEKFEYITYDCFLQAVLQINAMKDKATIDGAIIELNTMYYNKTGKFSDVDKYVIALAHKTVNIYLSSNYPDIFINPMCYDKKTNKHYARIWVDEK